MIAAQRMEGTLRDKTGDTTSCVQVRVDHLMASPIHTALKTSNHPLTPWPQLFLCKASPLVSALQASSSASLPSLGQHSLTRAR